MRSCSIIFVECFIWPLLGDGRLAMHLPVANYAAGFCVVRERLSKEWSFKMTSFAALPTEMQCDGSAIILAGPTVIIERKHVLKSALLWLLGYWTGPPVHIYPLRTVPQGSRHHHGRNCAAFNRRDVIIDLPAFLPTRNAQRVEEACAP